MRNKFNEFQSIICVENFDIIAISESWLDCGNRDFVGSFSLPNYKLFHRDRQTRLGGGVMLYVRNEIEAVVINSTSICNTDIIAVSLNVNKTKFNIAIVYRPPSQEECNDRELFDFLSDLSKQRLTVIMGDLNFPNVNYANDCADSEGSRLVNFLNDNFLYQMVREPTRGNNILDLILTTDENFVEGVEVGTQVGTSDHNSLRFKLKASFCSKSKIKVISNFKNTNFDSFRNDLKSSNWNDIFASSESSTMYANFLRKFFEYENKHVPKKNISLENNKSAPWFNNAIKNAIKNRDQCYTRSKVNDSEVNHNAYVQKRRLVKREVRKAKREYEVNLASNCKTNPKKFYSYVNKRKTVRENLDAIKNNNGNIVSNPKEIASILNYKFSEYFTHENLSNIPIADNVMNFDETNTLTDVSVSESELLFYIDKMNCSKSPGPDLIHPRHLRELGAELVTSLCKIFNKSLSEGVVPEEFKLANITPIFKKGDKSDPSNYRPISLTSVIGKLLESVIRDRIVEHLEKNNLIKDSQHGFRRNRSCLTNLLDFFHDMFTNNDKHKAVDIIYLDFQKAFDSVPHKRLLEKLRAHGIRGALLKWIESWLTARKQRVVLNGEYSDWVNVTSGVPQGSVLGPVLFIIYVNDLDTNLLGKIAKFADDAKLGHKAVNERDRVTIQRNLDTLFDWSCTWQINFNLSKCKVMHIGYHNGNFDYTLGGHLLESVTTERDLGVLISNDLKSSKHCVQLAKQANKILGFIARNFEFKSRSIIVPLYKSMVRPVLEYGAQFWSPFLEKDITLLERVQRRATKLIPELRNKTYETRLKELNLLSLKDRRLRGQLIEVFKILNGFDKLNVNSLFELAPDSSTRTNGFKLTLKRFETNITGNFFTYKITSIWNVLPSHVVNSSSVNMFKNRLDKHLFNK